MENFWHFLLMMWIASCLSYSVDDVSMLSRMKSQKFSNFFICIACGQFYDSFLVADVLDADNKKLFQKF